MNFQVVSLRDSLAAAHNFTPVKIDSNGVAKWADKIAGIPIGFPILTMSVKEPAPKGAPLYKVTLKLALPQLEQSSPSTATGYQPAPALAYSHYATLEFVCPSRGTPANRKDMLTYVQDLLASAVAYDAIVDLNSAT